MQETIVQAGKTSIAGSIAYVEQEPFIFSASVQKNIMFGLEYNKERMEKAVKVASQKL